MSNRGPEIWRGGHGDFQNGSRRRTDGNLDREDALLDLGPTGRRGRHRVAERLYTSVEWGTLCAEVAKLKLTPRAGPIPVSELLRDQPSAFRRLAPLERLF